MLEIGAMAPEFELMADGDELIRSGDLKGQPYVIYFYPKNNTPGCTTEACDFRDAEPDFTQAGVKVFGVSSDSTASHTRFREKHSLPFRLLSDGEQVLQRAYGAWGLKKTFGREYEGTIRSTFLIDKDGKIAAAWPKVRVKGHVDAVREAVAALGAS